jgi:hypothetical protein
MKWSQRYLFRAFLKNSPEASFDPPRRYVPLPWVYLGDLEDPIKTERPLVDPGTRPVFRSSPFNDFLFFSLSLSFPLLNGSRRALRLKQPREDRNNSAEREFVRLSFLSFHFLLI